MVHSLKISPTYYDAVEHGLKPFEVRKKDRPFAVGDTVILYEYDERYTGRALHRIITYILDDPKYCKEGHVIFSLSD